MATTTRRRGGQFRGRVNSPLPTRNQITMQPVMDPALNRMMPCNVFGHAWLFVTDFGYILGLDHSIVEFQRRIQCARCETTRTDRMSVPLRRLIGRYYQHTDKYYEIRADDRETFLFDSFLQASIGARVEAAPQ